MLFGFAEPAFRPVTRGRQCTTSQFAEPPDSTGDRRLLLVFLKRLENQVAQFVLRRSLDDGPEQREAAPLAVDAVLSCRKCDIAAGPAAAFPDAETNQFETLERAFAEMDFGVGELAGRVPCVVCRHLDR